MKALAFTVAATVDLEEICNYTEGEWGLAQARRYAEELRDTCHALASGERRGRKVDVRPGYMKCRSGSHIIFFRDLGDTLEIVRILHGAQDVERHL
ncbi:type II toxin-antitoxin system RelE/ParE family toxin [Paracoccus denitrificans]|uniref:type II toxin-antitoxin system RelE/ParE family toxin n=1 Tax=Paracoccus denitrificans TaxID=266 RepID=UPI001E2A61D6|nr:type II toxin-antitoxin system RelE/ParE family toxin [Paracoccus denitrificans]UFS65732.1 type II toxin-antitoxin system RelE/ParE family toxin [Paracoccus denitrificans]